MANKEQGNRKAKTNKPKLSAKEKKERKERKEAASRNR